MAIFENGDILQYPDRGFVVTLVKLKDGDKGFRFMFSDTGSIGSFAFSQEEIKVLVETGFTYRGHIRDYVK